MISATDVIQAELERDDVKLRYRLRQGEPGRETVVFVHGWAGSQHDWDAILPNFPNWLTYDAAGFGGSQFADKAARDKVDFSLARYEADLLALLYHAGLDQVRLVGHSWGGVLAMSFAAHHPSRVSSLVAVGAAWYDPDNKLHVALKWVSWLMTLLIIWLKPAMRKYGWLRRAAVRRYTYRPLPSELGEAVMRDVLDSDDFALIQTLFSGYEVRFKSICPAIAAPTLYVAGQRDVVAQVPFVRRFVSLTPAARYAELTDCGHFPMLEQPAEFCQLLEEFHHGDTEAQRKF